MSREKAKHELKKTMKDLSEELFCSSWNVNFEYELWKAVFNAKDKNIALDEETKNLLCRLYNKAGGWWTHQGSGAGLVFVPAYSWEKMVLAKNKTAASTKKTNIEEHLEGQMGILERQNADLHSRIRGLEKIIQELEEENEKLRTQNCISYVQKPKQKETLEQRVEKVEELLDTWDEQFENMDGRLDENASCIEDVAGSLNHLEGEVSELQQNFEDFEREIRDHNDRLGECETEIQNLQDEVTEIDLKV